MAIFGRFFSLLGARNRFDFERDRQQALSLTLGSLRERFGAGVYGQDIFQAVAGEEEALPEPRLPFNLRHPRIMPPAPGLAVAEAFAPEQPDIITQQFIAGQPGARVGEVVPRARILAGGLEATRFREEIERGTPEQRAALIPLREALEDEELSALDFTTVLRLQREQPDQVLTAPVEVRRKVNRVLARTLAPDVGPAYIPRISEAEAPGQPEPGAPRRVGEEEDGGLLRDVIEIGKRVAGVGAPGPVPSPTEFVLGLLDREQEIANVTRPGLERLGLPEPVADVVSQIALPSSLVPFVGLANKARLVRIGLRAVQGALLGAAQTRAYVRNREGREPTVEEIAFGAVTGGAGAAALPELVTGAGRLLRGRGITPRAPEGLQEAVPDLGRRTEAPAAAPIEEAAIPTRPAVEVPIEAAPAIAPEAEPLRGALRRAVLEGVPPEQAVREAAPVTAPAALDDLARIDPDLAAGREPELMPGVGAATAELPTMRVVEARSARIPIADKRAVATEIFENTAPDARPLSVDEVAAQFGDRYQSNWFTRLDDVIAPLRGKDRPLEKAVRNTMVTRDLYTHQEAYIQLQRVNAWMGRNKDVLGLRYEARAPGLEGRWYARGVQPRPGAKIPKRALQRLKDIRERPDDYIISPEQQRALDEAGDLFERMKLSNYQHGVDFEAVDPKTYWPGVVTNAPERSGIPVYRGQGAELTSTPGWAKPRQVPTLREGLAAGADYADDLEAMTIRLAGGAEANGNRWAVEQVQRLGLKPSEKVSTRLSQNLRDAQVAYKQARAAAAKVGPSSPARQTAIQAEIALDYAKAAMRAEANRVNMLRPRVFGRVVAPDVAKELGRYVTTTDPGIVGDVLQLWRGSMVTGDHSALFNQNMMLFWRNNPAWMKAAAYSSMAFKEAPYAWAAKNAPDIEAAIRTGFAAPPTEFLLRQGGGISHFFGRLPVVRQSQRAFEWNIFIGQVERYKAAKGLNLSKQELIDMASVTRKQAGILWMPGTTKAQARALSATFFAPQYTTAFISVLTDPLTKTGAARREALKSLSLMFGGAASTTIGFNVLINGEMPNITDPKKPGYWGIRIGDSHVYPLGPFQPLVRALALTREGDRQALPRFLEGKASVPARMLLRAAEAMGAPLESIRGYPYSDPTETFGPRGLGESFIDIAPVPIGAGQAVEGIREGAALPLVEPLGIRTTTMTERQKFREQYPMTQEDVKGYDAIEGAEHIRGEDARERDRDKKRLAWRESHPEADAWLYLYDYRNYTTVRSRKAARIVEEISGQRLVFRDGVWKLPESEED